MPHALAVLVVALLTLDVFPQAPPPPPPMPMQMPGRDAAQKTGTARLSGRVTALDSGRPIRRAVIRASAPDMREPRSVSTDAEGRWELRDLPAGRYNVMVTKGGYVSLNFGQLRPFEQGKTIELKDGQAEEKIDVVLPRGGVISGRVVDEFGEPVIGARVSPHRHRYMNGRRQLTALTSDTTDDLGAFRLHGLSPGDYYVSAQSNTFTFLGTSEDRTGYGQTFYPGTLNQAEATRVTVAVGQETQNIVLALVPSRIATLSGTLTTSTGKPAPMGMVMLRDVAAGAAPMVMSPGMVRDGTWTISGVTPGEYQLMAQAFSDLARLEAVAMTGGSAGVLPETSVQSITVTGEDIKGIALTTSAGGSATGRVRFEGGKPPATPPTGFSIQGFDVQNAGSLNMASGLVKQDWTFTVGGLLGRRVIRPIGQLPGWYLKSVTHEGTDITDSGVNAADGAELSGIEIVMTQDVAEVSGTVQDSKGTPATDYVVVLFAPDAEKWGWQTRFVRVARPDQTGRFLSRGLPPGSYLAVALEYIEPGEETNPEFLERIKAMGTTVRLDEGEKKSLTLRLSAQ
jgi:hypothetical protein